MTTNKQPEPELAISLEGVHVEFPTGWWDDPSNDLQLRDGRTLLNARIDHLALMIAAGLRKLLRERRPPTGLVDSSGRALVAPSPPRAADTLDHEVTSEA